MQLHDSSGIAIPKDCEGKSCLSKSNWNWDDAIDCGHVPQYGVDWLGNEVHVGSEVIYAQMSGRCVQLVKGIVLDIYASHFRIQPNAGNRWGTRSWRTILVDTRTGKKISPKNKKHIERESYITCTESGLELDDYAKGPCHPSHYDRFGMSLYNYFPVQYKDYIREQAEGVRPVTILITNNLTLWNPA